MFSPVPPAVLAAAAGLLLFMAVLGTLLYQVAYGPRAKLQKRMAQVLGTAAAQKNARQAPAQQKKRQIRLKDGNAGKRKPYALRLSEDIAQAGLSWSLKKYALFSLALAVAGAIAYRLSGMPDIGLPFAAVTMGLGAPRVLLRFRSKRRVLRFMSLFPDALDVIIRGIKSGLPVAECINVIGREMPDPVGTEFRLIAESQRLGMTLDDALRRATERVPNPELRFFAIVLTIQQQTGGNLADTLQKLSDVLRGRKKMRDKIRAMSSEAKASAGIIGSLPFIVSGLLALVSPEYIGLLFTTTIGHAIIGVGLTTMGVGILVMRQMINFDI